MKILHINKFFDLNGGAEIYMHRVMERQSDAGHEVHAFSTRSTGNLPSNDKKYFVHRFDYTKFEGIRADSKKALAFLWNTEAKRATERILNEVQPDVIHLHNVYHHLSSSILAPIRQSGIRCVHTLHDLKLACPNYSMFTEGEVCERCKGGRYWNAVTHRCLFPATVGNVLGACEIAMTKFRKSYERTVDQFITPSRFYRDIFVRWGEPAGKFTVLPNPADVADEPAEGGGGYILYVGRLSQEKGVDTLIHAIARTPTLPLRIAGAGPEEERLRQLVRTLGAAHVTFLGFVQQEELARIRARAEALVVPSVWYENCPLSALEALGQGIPIIGSRIGGIPELVRDGKEGLLAEPGDVNAWAASLQYFRSLAPEERRAMREHGQERIRERHDWTNHLTELEKMYHGG